MLYLDNAATEYPKPRRVRREVMRCITRYCGNPQRSSHYYSVRASEEVYLARVAVAELFGAESEECVVFTENATYALNLAIKSLIRSPCHILISDLEHNATLRPTVQLAERRGYSYSVFSTVGDIEGSLEESLRPDTGAIITTLASNVNGRIIPPVVISDFAKRHGLISIADASQFAGHYPIDLRECPFTALCAPAHKGLLGIQGAGVAVFDGGAVTDTFIEGGSGSDSRSPVMPTRLPDRLEAGTLPTPSIVALRRGIEVIKDRGLGEIGYSLARVSAAFCDRLSEIKGCEVFSEGCGIISFRVSGITTDTIASALDKAGICVRAGLHCAPLAHRTLGTVDTGLVRISLSLFNHIRESDIFYRELKKILT